MYMFHQVHLLLQLRRVCKALQSPCIIYLKSLLREVICSQVRFVLHLDNSVFNFSLCLYEEESSTNGQCCSGYVCSSSKMIIN